MGGRYTIRRKEGRGGKGRGVERGEVNERR